LIHIYFAAEDNVTIYGGADVPVGDSDFKNIVTNGFSFVGKTLLTKDVITKSTCVTLVVRPRHFGKTTNLTMLRDFFCIPIYPDNKEYWQKLFKGSKIETQNKELFEKHFFLQVSSHLSLKVWQWLVTFSSSINSLFPRTSIIVRLHR